MTFVFIPNFFLSHNTIYFPVIYKLYLVICLFFPFLLSSPFKNHRNRRIVNIQYGDLLHGFVSGCGDGTDCLVG